MDAAKLRQLRSIIERSDNIVFFGGAGVSTESGIPDYRSSSGLYSQKYDCPPEEILSRSFFVTHRAGFYAFYRDRMLHPDAQPNAAHRALAKLEARGKLRAVITQNVDGLHQAAGSHEVIELHGSIHRNYCELCGKPFPLQYILDAPDVPLCACGGVVRPDVVLYEESLDSETMDHAIAFISRAQVLIIGGTSLAVYPAASFVRAFAGDHLIVINKQETQSDYRADMVFRDPIGEVLGSL